VDAEAREAWDSHGVTWPATGVAAAAVLAPLLTSVSSIEVYVEADSPAGQEARTADAGFRPIEGGRAAGSRFALSPQRACHRSLNDTTGSTLATRGRRPASIRRAR
jgi:hypothetical protein